MRFAFVLALRLGRTVQELGKTLTEEEFRQWRVMFTIEELEPSTDARRHAAVIAAIANGPLRKRDKKPWEPVHFLPANRWSIDPPKREQPTPQQLRDQVATLNAQMRRH